MRAHSHNALSFHTPAFNMDFRAPALSPKEMVRQAAGVITNDGKTTVRRQLLELAVLVAFVAEMGVIFYLLG